MIAENIYINLNQIKHELTKSIDCHDYSLTIDNIGFSKFLDDDVKYFSTNNSAQTVCYPHDTEYPACSLSINAKENCSVLG